MTEIDWLIAIEPNKTWSGAIYNREIYEIKKVQVFFIIYNMN